MSAQGPACAVEAAAVAPPPVRSPLRHVQLENLAAGLSGGVVSTLVLHPLDLVKIRFAGEAGPAPRAHAPPRDGPGREAVGPTPRGRRAPGGGG